MRYEPRTLKLGGLGILFNLTKSVDFDDSEGKREEFVQVWAGFLLIRKFLSLVLFAGADVVLVAFR